MKEYEKQNLHGWDKFLYNMYMILTFPVRKWWIILGVLATILLVLIIIPTMDGIKKEDIVDWYKAKWTHSDVNKAKNQTIAMLAKRANKLKNNVKEILPDSENKNNRQVQKKESDLVAWNVAEFKKAKYVPAAKKADANEKVYDSNTFALIKAQMKNSSATKTKKTKVKTEKILSQIKPEIDVDNDEDFSVYYEIRTDLNLAYLDEPETISDKATAAGANELYIGEDFVYLYGIYTNPRKYDVKEAKDFLQNVIYDQNVECDVVAYSTQTQAKTALCFVNGVLINKQMVAEGLADNVALKME